jgi:hypothetical protein
MKRNVKMEVLWDETRIIWWIVFHVSAGHSLHTVKVKATGFSETTVPSTELHDVISQKAVIFSPFRSVETDVIRDVISFNSRKIV